MNDNVHSLIGAYAVNALDDAERAQVEEHLRDCAECRDELAGYLEATAALGDAEALAPPASLRARVFDEVAQTSQLTPVDDAPAARPDPIEVAADYSADAPVADDLAARRESRAARRWWPALAGAAATVAIAVFVFAPGSGDSTTESELAMEKDVMMVASAPDAHSMDLDLGNGHVVKSERMDGLAVMGASAPLPEKGMEYQLWLEMDDGKSMPGPTFMPHDDGEYMTLVHTDFEGVVSVSVTEEPAGGSESPTSEPISTVTL